MKLQELKSNPWRFKVGSRCYIAGNPQEPARVTEAIRCGRFDWPHYVVMDYQGNTWTVAQVQLSRLPINP